LIEQFLAFEREHAPARWDVAGTLVWPYVRQRVFDDWSRERGVHSERQSPPQRLYLRHAREQRGQLGRVLERYDARRLSRAPILFLSHSRHYALEGRHVSPYTHYLLNDLSDEAYWDLQFSDGGRHHVDDGLRRVVYLDAIHQAAFKGYALAHRWGAVRRSVRSAAHDMRASLQRELGLALPAERLDRWLWNAVRTHHGYGAVCERILDRVRPELLINVVHYSWPNLTMTECAHRRGIVVAELQHGTVWPEHIAYNLGSTSAAPSTPDYFLSFGEFWSEMVVGLGLPPGHTPAIGFSWLEQRMAAAPRAADKTLLVLSQRSIGVELSRWAVEAAPKLAAHGWRTIYRLHAGEVADHRERLPWLTGAPLTVSTGTPELYSQFGTVGAQLGVYSTALFEGVAFGLPTLIARLPGSAAMTRLVQYGGARFVDGASDVVEALRDIAGAGSGLAGGSEGGSDRGAADLARRVWQPRAVENFRRFTESRLAEAGSDPARGVA
jgi:hypothetical protein